MEGGLKIFCVRTLVIWSRFTMRAEFACRGLKQKQQWTHSEALLRASSTRLEEFVAGWYEFTHASSYIRLRMQSVNHIRFCTYELVLLLFIKTVWRVFGKSNWREEGHQYQWRQRRTSKTFWRVFGESNWREEGSQYQWRPGRTSKTFWRVFGESNWREEGSQYQWRQNKQDVLASLWRVKLAGRG